MEQTGRKNKKADSLRIEKPKKPPNYHNRLWKIFSEYIRRKEKGRCYTCGIIKDYREMDAGHFIDKSISGEVLYFSEVNVHCQCDKCNRYLSGAKDVYAQKLVQDYGPHILDQLFAQKALLIKWYNADYLDKLVMYKRKLKVLRLKQV